MFRCIYPSTYLIEKENIHEEKQRLSSRAEGTKHIRISYWNETE